MFDARDTSLSIRGFKMLELRELHRLGGLPDGVVVPVKVFADRVDRALDVHVRHGGHHDAKLDVTVTRLESTLLTFAHLVLISCVHEICFHKTHQQRESGLRDKAAETIDDNDATRVDTGQFGEGEMERRSAKTRLGQVHMSCDPVSLPSRLNVADLQFEMQRL